MAIIQSLLATEVLASIVMLGAVALVVRSYLHYSKDASELAPKHDKLNKELEKLRKNIDPRKKVVSSLSKLVTPIKDRSDKYAAITKSSARLNSRRKRPLLPTWKRWNRKSAAACNESAWALAAARETRKVKGRLRPLPIRTSLTVYAGKSFGR